MVTKPKNTPINLVIIGGFFENAKIILENFSSVELINLRYLNPIDYRTVKASVIKTKKLFCIEDGYYKSSIAASLALRLLDDNIKFTSKIIAVPEKFIFSKDYKDSCKQALLDTKSILKTFQKFVKNNL